MNNNYIGTLSRQEKEIFIKVIYVLAKVNDKIEQEEINKIKNLSKLYSFSSDDLKEILTSTSADSILKEAKAITDNKKALQLIKEMFLLTNSDGEISDAEIDFILEVATAVDVDLEDVKEINRFVVDLLILEEKDDLIFG